MAVRDDRGDVKQTTTGFRGPLMVQSLTSAKSKFLSLDQLGPMRPAMALSRYATSIQGLFCGSAGIHPGGGVSGRPGWLAGRNMISS